jgi:lipopolysaccharide exporter
MSIQTRLKIPEKSFFRSFATVSGGTVIAQVIQMLSGLGLARIYSPSDFGIYASVTAIASVLSVFASLKYEQAILLEKDERYSKALLTICVSLCFFISLIVGVVLFFSSDFLTKLLKMNTVKPYLWMISLSILGAGLYQILSFRMMQRGEFHLTAQTRVVQSISMSIVQFLFPVVVKTVNPLGLVLGDITGRFFGTERIIREIVDAYRSKWPSWEDIQFTLLRYVEFPRYAIWANLFNVVGLQAPFLLTTTFFGAATNGMLALSFRILGIPLMLISQSIGQVLLSKLTNDADDPVKFTQIIKKVTLVLIFSGIPIFFTTQLMSRWAFTTFFGARWDQAGVYAQILSPWFFFWLVGNPLSGVLIAKKMQAFSFSFTIFEVSFRVLGLFIFSKYGNDVQAISFLSFSGCIISVTAIIFYLRFAGIDFRLISLKSIKLIIPFLLYFTLSLIINAFFGIFAALPVFLICLIFYIRITKEYFMSYLKGNI